MAKLFINDTTRSVIDKTSHNLPQALLICGKQGTGIGTIAASIASANGTILDTVLPKKRQPSGSLAVDIENGSIVIDDIRALYERTRSKFSSRQIVIIDFSGRSMTHGAQNAFLKLLEEPQQNVHFILACSNTSQLLPTILSRCQRIEVLPISDSQSVELLDELNVTDATLRARILFIANGLPAEIIKLVNDSEYYETRVKTVQDARIILEGESYVRLTTIQKYRDKRPLALQLINDMIRQVELAAKKTPDHALLHQLDTLIDAYERIRANGNIALSLAKVLL